MVHMLPQLVPVGARLGQSPFTWDITRPLQFAELTIQVGDFALRLVHFPEDVAGIVVQLAEAGLNPIYCLSGWKRQAFQSLKRPRPEPYPCNLDLGLFSFHLQGCTLLVTCCL